MKGVPGEWVERGASFDRRWNHLKVETRRGLENEMLRNDVYGTRFQLVDRENFSFVDVHAK